MAIRYPFLIFILCYFTFPFSGLAQTAEEMPEAPAISLFTFLQQQDSVPLLKIETDWGLLLKNKLQEEYQPVTLSFTGPDGRETTVECRMRARGNTRKKVCTIPPVKIKIPKKQLKALGFNSSNDLKLVLPCQGGRFDQDCLLREEMAYRLYELIHPVHLRTKVIRLQHWEGQAESHDFLAFLVEDEEEFEDRLGGKIINRGRIRYAGLDREAYLRMVFFQYMIANTDWGIQNRHNLETIKVPGYERLIAVPYDFDYAGMVGTSYAIPHESMPIKSVTDRHFRGESITKEEVRKMRAFFLEHKAAVLQHCDSMPFFHKRAGRQTRKFVEEFFDELENERRLIRKLCK